MSTDTRHISFWPLQKLLRNVIGLTVIPNMDIYMKWTNHLVGGCFESGSRRLVDKNWEYKWGLKECLSRSRDAWGGGPVPRSSASCVVWGLKLGTLSTTNCALVPFMNIHSGAFRPRLISREIDEETRTFYHKRSVSPLAFSRGCWQNSPSSLAKKEKGKKLPEKHGTIWASNWMGKQCFFLMHI